MPAGRPSKYDPIYADKLLEYFSNAEPFQIVTDEKGKQSLFPNKLPTIERFAASIGVDPNTIGNWANAHPEFFGAINEAKAMQRDMLIQGGLMGSYKDTIVKLILSTNHGMSEKTSQDITHKNPDGSAMSITVAFVNGEG
ncbi:MAG: hypothetical protein E6Q97_29245 [Desulfurellales bacterium]|nr:MAG: hypothetical protein E6Q97_29245 [Desulfurellales bacterium]